MSFSPTSGGNSSAAQSAAPSAASSAPANPRKRGREDPDGFELGRQVANLEVEIQAEVREATRVQAQRDAVQQQLDVMLERIQRKLDLYTELTGWSPSVVEETE